MFCSTLLDMSPARTIAPSAAGDPVPRRRYDSSLRAKRAEETKAAITSAATALFTSKGWANTGMREVARDAGVAVETLYSHFSSKRKLLDAVVDQAVVGGDQPLAVAERPEFVAMGHGGRADRLAAAATLLASIHERTAPFAKLVREAAMRDQEVAELLAATRERQRKDVEAGLELIVGRPPSVDERDGAWAIVSPEVYLLLVEGSGWSPDQYQRWLSDTLERILPHR